MGMPTRCVATISKYNHPNESLLDVMLCGVSIQHSFIHRVMYGSNIFCEILMNLL